MRKAAKLPLDFTHRIRYNKSRSKAMRRCVGMADEGDSKSLVLITRVGSTPTTGIKRKPSSLSGGLSFYLRRVSGSNSTALPSRASDQPCGLSLSARETPTTGIKRSSLSLSGGVLFLSAACDHDLVVCIGRDRHAGLHHFQPVHEKIVEKYRGVIKAGVNRLDGVRFQSVTVNGILKGIRRVNFWNSVHTALTPWNRLHLNALDCLSQIFRFFFVINRH